MLMSGLRLSDLNKETTNLLTYCYSQTHARIQETYLKESVRVFKANINRYFNPDSASHTQSINQLENVAIANALPLEAARATPAPSRFNYDAMPSLKSLNLSIAVL